MKLVDTVSILFELQNQGMILDFAYNHFADAQALPFAIYMEQDSNATFADDRTYHIDAPVEIELYTENKDLALEEALELLLAGYAYDKEASEWIDEEKCYMTLYTVT